MFDSPLIFFQITFQTFLLTEVKGTSKSANLSNHPDPQYHSLMIWIMVCFEVTATLAYTI